MKSIKWYLHPKTRSKSESSELPVSLTSYLRTVTSWPNSILNFYLGTVGQR